MASFFRNLVHLAELIHVQLSDEGGQVSVPEEVRDHFLLQFFWGFDLNLGAIGGPCNVVTVLWFLYSNQWVTSRI